MPRKKTLKISFTSVNINGAFNNHEGYEEAEFKRALVLWGGVGWGMCVRLLNHDIC